MFLGFFLISSMCFLIKAFGELSRTFFAAPRRSMPVGPSDAENKILHSADKMSLSAGR